MNNTLNEQQALNVALGYGLSDYVAANNVQSHHAGASGTKGTVTGTAAGAGSVIRCSSVGHGRTTGEKLELRLNDQNEGFGVEYTITVIDVDTFDLQATTYPGHSQTGTWELTEDTTNKYYPGVSRWAVLKAIGGDVTFDAGNTVDVITGMLRPGDPPQEDEVIASGQVWQEGALTTFKMKTAGGAARLLRG